MFGQTCLKGPDSILKLLESPTITQVPELFNMLLTEFIYLPLQEHKMEILHCCQVMSAWIFDTWMEEIYSTD